MSNPTTRTRGLRNPLRMFFAADPWAATLYLASYLIVGTVLFSVVLSTVVLAGALSVLWIGLPLLVGVAGIVRGSAEIERWRARLVSGPVGSAYRTVRGTGVLAQLKTRWSDPSTWRDLGYLLLLYVPLFVLDTVVLVLWLALLGLITLPLWFWAIPHSWDNGVTAHGLAIGALPDGPHTTVGPDGFGLWVGDLPTALAVAAAALVLAILVSTVVTAAARLHAAAVRSVLGPPADPLAASKQALGRDPGALS